MRQASPNQFAFQFCFIENYEFRTYDDILEDDIVIPGLVVTVAPGIYAEQYCREQGIPYEYAK